MAEGVGLVFAGRRKESGRTWGADRRGWMTVEEMWDRHPERFADPGVGPAEPEPLADEPALAS